MVIYNPEISSSSDDFDDSSCEYDGINVVYTNHHQFDKNTANKAKETQYYDIMNNTPALQSANQHNNCTVAKSITRSISSSISRSSSSSSRSSTSCSTSSSSRTSSRSSSSKSLTSSSRSSQKRPIKRRRITINIYCNAVNINNESN